ncbi:hypothetical protein A3C73_03315 [Candidatus Giovannonibacteria bacterium RIFCSPHIGHO2_02_FULL_44_11]|nr:MAG: hypothetical protein A3C73_03315 [Candidatus Giovannonibacteria bacterium RIFCSPHIGHO2_02_FULL_44_11]
MAEISSLMPKKVSSGMEYYKNEGLGALLRLSLILFILASVLTGLLFAYKGLLARQLDQQRQILSDLQVQFEPSLVAQLEHVASTITNAKMLLNKHLFITPVFNFLEKHTLPDVSFSSFNYSADKKTLTLNGEAPSYTEISAQIKTFQNQQEVAAASFANTALRDAGSVVFNTIINFK